MDKKRTNKPGAGRPRKPLLPVEEQIARAYGAGYTQKSIAYQLGISVDTLKANYSDSLEKGSSVRENWAIDLMRSLAEKGNATAIKFILWHIFGYKERDNAPAEKKDFNVTVNVDGVAMAIKQLEGGGNVENTEAATVHSENGNDRLQGAESSA